MDKKIGVMDHENGSRNRREKDESQRVVILGHSFCQNVCDQPLNNNDNAVLASWLNSTFFFRYMSFHQVSFGLPYPILTYVCQDIEVR